MSESYRNLRNSALCQVIHFAGVRRFGEAQPLFSSDPCANPFEGPRGWSRTQQFAARRQPRSPIRDGSLAETEEQALALIYLL